jgi:predicted transcriptional regulator of viral defense system
MPVGQLRDLDDELLAEGQFSLTVAAAVERTGRSEAAVRSGLQRLMDQRRIFSPARGFYVVVPAEYRSWGVVPAMWFIDPMMRHLDRDYYVGLMSAAEAHGAAHQRPQVFQVITDRALRNRDVERVQLRMYAKRSINPNGVQRVNTHTGTAAVSTPELTVIDMAARLEHVGGLDNLATVVQELVSDGLLDARRFATVAASEARASVRRAGWLIEQFTDVQLDEAADLDPNAEPVNLDPFGERRGHVDPRWGVRVNASPESEA